MRKLVGYIHFRDTKIKGTNSNSRSSEVFLQKSPAGWQIFVPGWNPAAFPPPTHDELEAQSRVRVFIQTRKGTCLKKQKVVST